MLKELLNEKAEQLNEAADTIDVTVSFNKADFLKTLASAGKSFDMTLNDDIDMNELVHVMKGDIEIFVGDDLGEFLKEGLNNDVYTKFFTQDGK